METILMTIMTLGCDQYSMSSCFVCFVFLTVEAHLSKALFLFFVNIRINVE